jgi:hypothetical protein
MLAHALLGAGLAGTYMPGLKELSDRTAGSLRQARGIAFLHLDLRHRPAACRCGWRASFTRTPAGATRSALSAAGPIAAGALILIALPPAPFTPKAALRRSLFSMVLRDRRIAGYITGYAAHCWELFAVRAWIVAFLGFAAPGGPHLRADDRRHHQPAGDRPASISGNEIASGRRVRVVRVTMAAGAALALATGFVTGMSTVVVILVTSLYVLAIMADSAALTAD